MRIWAILMEEELEQYSTSFHMDSPALARSNAADAFYTLLRK